MNILSIIVFCSLAVAIKGGMTKEEGLEALKSIAANCVTEVGASDSDLDAVMKNLPAPNMETKCLRACIMKKVTMLSPEGKLDRANVLKLADEHLQGDPAKIKIATAITDVCESLSVPDDHCEAAEMYKMCAQAEAKKHGVVDFF